MRGLFDVVNLIIIVILNSCIFYNLGKEKGMEEATKILNGEDK